MKFLFVTNESLSADLAWQLVKEKHEVKMYCRGQGEKDVGLGFFEKVDEWEPFKDWADVIIFDDIGFGSKAEQLRNEGKFVVGGSPYSDKLELDREFGQSELNQVGVDVLPSWNFTSFDEAIEFVRSNPDRYVLKPSGKAQNEKELLFIGQEPDGKDVLSILEHYKLNWAKKIKEFQLQKFAEGVEVAVGAFFNGKDFVMPICVNFEHKRLFPNELGPSTGEMGCYDEETEVLTKEGWKHFAEVTYSDAICTLNPATHDIEYQFPDSLVTYAHHRRMISIKNRSIDILVTPDHNMYVQTQQDFKEGRRRFQFVKARELQSQSVVKRNGKWTGIEQTEFILPSVTVTDMRQSQGQVQQTEELVISMDLWLKFLGVWLSDGHVTRAQGDGMSSYMVGIAQKKGLQREEIRQMLGKFPIGFAESGDQFYVHDKQLGQYLEQFGKAPEKFVPSFIKELSPRQIGIFLDWFAKGDGTQMKHGFRIYYTSSKILADDIQELLLKTGRVGLVKSRVREARRWIIERFADSSRPQFEVIERVRKVNSWLDRRDMSIVEYHGRVYCATVKNHVMYVRRNGKPYWCGNTSMFYTRNSPVFERTLLKMKERLAAGGYTGYIDINCIANVKGIWPLEFTCFDRETEILTRDGWKGYDDVRVGDQALSIDPLTRNIEWKSIIGRMVRDYDGPMVRFSAKNGKHTGLDALVTPDHNMLIDYSGSLRFSRADSIPIHETRLVRYGTFSGKVIDSVTIPEYVETHHLGRHHTTMQIIHPQKEVGAEPFMKFLGLYLAEGSLGDYILSIAQSPDGDKRAEIEEILDETGLKYATQKSGAYQFSSRQLCVFFEGLGLKQVGAAEKFVPRQFKDLEPSLLEALLHGYRLGDGNVHGRTGQVSFASSSRRLAGDIQELLTKCGKVANIRVHKAKGTVGIGGYRRNGDMYIVSVRDVKRDYSLDKRVISTEHYTGKVWDVEVEDWHTMLVRRRGKPFFSGNCRFGYPTISIQMEGITSEWGQILYDLAHGNDAVVKTKKGYQVGVVISIPPFPFEDEKAFKKYSEGATILFRRQNLDGVHIGEVKLEEGDWHIAGNSGYALIVTGSGATMSDAIDRAYQNVKNVMIPNMFYRTDIGQRWTHDSDMLLSWGYL